MNFPEYERYDALGLAELVRKKQVSPRQLVDAAIDRIEKVNPRINAVICELFDRARSAATSDLPDGPFRGVPFLLKDVLAALADTPLSSGSRFFGGYVPERNSRLVDRFLRSGVIVVGKTNTPEFALMPVTEPERFGPTKNPWDETRTTGGSSGGSAASVAARLVPMASGGDGGGSIRIPSSCCGVFGFKPTPGRTPTGPFEAEVWEGFSTEHVITKSVRDSAAMLDATTGPEPGEAMLLPRPSRPFLDEVTTPPGKRRIAFSRSSPLSSEIHPACLAALDDAIALLRELGHELVEVSLPIDGSEWKRTASIMMCGICAADVRDAERLLGKKATREGFERATWLTRALGETFTAGEYAAAVRDQKRVGLRVAEFLSSYDAWLTPTLGEPPPKLGAFYKTGVMKSVEELVARYQLGKLARHSGELEKLADQIFSFIPFTMLANGARLPAMSVPLHFSADGLPIGVMLTGRFAEDALLFRLAGELERARPWADRTPPLKNA